MKKIIALSVILTIFLAENITAQIYIVDDNFKDSAEVYNIVLSADKEAEMPGATAFKLPMGTTVTVERTLKGNPGYPLIHYNGKEYTMSNGYLLFSDENGAEVEDIFGDTRERVNHSTVGKFFATMTPYWIISVLFVIAIALTFLGFKSHVLKELAIRIVPVTILMASLFEIWAVWVMGDSAFWWCDKDRYGFWGSLFRAIPFVAFVVFQLLSIKFYKRLILGKNPQKDVSLKPMAVSIGICVPVLIVVALICSLSKMNGTLADILTLIAFLLSLSIGLWVSAKRNVAALGHTAGLAFTFFAAVYIVGSIVAIYGMVLVMMRLIIQILMICAVIGGGTYVMSQGGNGGNSSTPQVYYDDDGTPHTSLAARDGANISINQRRKNESL